MIRSPTAPTVNPSGTSICISWLSGRRSTNRTSRLHNIASIAYIPLTYEDQLTGALEILSFAEPIDAAQIEELAPILQMAPPAILAAEKSEQQRQTLLDSVHRMTQLYDLEKSLNATLDMDAVTLAIPTKAAAMLPCQAVHLWLYDGGVLRLVSSCGDDPTVDVGITQAPGEGYVADMAEEGEPLLIDDPDDPRLVQRNAAATEENGIPPITNALLVPLTPTTKCCSAMRPSCVEDAITEEGKVMV